MQLQEMQRNKLDRKNVNRKHVEEKKKIDNKYLVLRNGDRILIEEFFLDNSTKERQKQKC